MKKSVFFILLLFILFLFPVICHGQQIVDQLDTDGIPTGIRGYASKQKLTSAIENVFTGNYEAGYEAAITLITVKMLFNNYAQECYNDSTLKIKTLPYGAGYEVPNIMHSPLARATKKYYTHRKPTFEGFIEYLKKTK